MSRSRPADPCCAARPGSGTLPGVDAYEPLGTGTLLMVDGRRADAGSLSDPDALEALLRELVHDLGAGEIARAARVLAADGSSHALVLDEAYLVLHAFPGAHAFSLKAFSRHALADVELLSRALRILRTGRFESTLRRRAAGLPHEPVALDGRLAGERAWARARALPYEEA